MQLGRAVPIRSTLATLTAALLGAGVAGAANLGESETSVLIYSESNRVSATELMFNMDRHIGGPWSFGLKLTYDGLTGATPTGAAPSKNTQTISRPSGGSDIVVQAGELPLDHNFKDARFAVDGSLSRTFGRMTSLSLGGHASGERDYSSFGVNGGLTRDLNNKNTTVGITGSYSHDVVSPIGGIGLPFTSPDSSYPWLPAASLNKEVYDYVVSLTQILNQQTVFRANFSFDQASGYLNDPYKVLSVVQDPGSPDAGEPIENLHENRPDFRIKRAVFSELRRYLWGHSIDLSYRYFWDTWGIKSHTVDIVFQYHLEGGSSFQPHIRWYRQSKADFFRPFLVQGVSLPTFASSDSRLAKFDAFTIGLKYLFSVSDDSRLAISAEYYLQRGDGSPPEAFGTQRQYNLFPVLDAIMLRVSLLHDL